MWRIILIVCFLLPVFSYASNAGIVRGLWYDQEEFFVGETVRVYVAVRNNTGADLSGTVEFFVNDKKIERKNIDALDGRIVESWADWTPKYGTSTVTATLSRTEITSTASGTQAIEVVSALAEDKIFIDYDTDGDDIGNLDDKDDDGDGKSDLEEVEAGTDPLVYDKPPTETEDEEEESQESDNNAEDGSSNYHNPTGSNEGLEQFLTPSRADTALTGVTEIVRNTKKSLDEYRGRLESKLNPPTPESIPVNEDGFGEVERISEEEQSRPKAEKPKGLFGEILYAVSRIAATVYTVILAAISYALGYPALIQVLLLFFLLYVVYRVSKKVGARPQ